MIDTDRVAALRDQGLSYRDIAAAMGTNLAAVQRAMARRPPPEDDEDDDDDDDDLDIRDVDGGELERLRAMEVADPSAVLTPPFDYSGVDDGALRWHDANGVVFGELDLYRWRQRINDIVPGDFVSEDEYMAAYRVADAETEAANAHAWATVPADVVYDDDRHRWVQRLRAV